MSIKKKILIFIGILIICGIIAALMGYWPVAFVNFRPITYSSFEKTYSAANNLYLNNLKAYKEDSSLADSADVQNELKRSTLETLIENEVVDQELSKRYKSSDLSRLIQEKLDKTNVDSPQIQKGSEILYGLSADDFKDIILTAKAKQEIMQGNLFGENQNYDSWLRQEKMNSKVIIFIPGFRWNNGEVELK